MTPWPLFLRRLNKRAVGFQTRFVASARAIGQPFQLALEGRSPCALRCAECEPDLSAPSSALTFDAARRTIDRHPAPVQLSLSLSGEPFLDDGVFEIIRYARARQIDVILRCDLCQRHFGEGAAQRLLDSDLSHLRVVIGWPVKGLRSSEARVVDANLAASNLETLCRLKAEQHRAAPHITWEVVTREGQDFQAATARAAHLGVDILALSLTIVNDPRREWKPAPWALARSAHRDKASLDQPTRSS